MSDPVLGTEGLGGDLRLDEPLARRTSWRVGRPTRLIEAAGLKGLREGGAQVSLKHANFIINTGAASARDIARLIQRMRSEVERTSGVRRIAEVCRVGGWTS